jgi:hypothetical protein
MIVSTRYPGCCEQNESVLLRNLVLERQSTMIKQVVVQMWTPFLH